MSGQIENKVESTNTDGTRQRFGQGYVNANEGAMVALVVTESRLGTAM